MVLLDQPVRFSAASFESVSNPRVNMVNQLHNEVSLIEVFGRLSPLFVVSATGCSRTLDSSAASCGVADSS